MSKQEFIDIDNFDYLIKLASEIIFIHNRFTSAESMALQNAHKALSQMGPKRVVYNFMIQDGEKFEDNLIK